MSCLFLQKWWSVSREKNVQVITLKASRLSKDKVAILVNEFTRRKVWDDYLQDFSLLLKIREHHEKVSPTTFSSHAWLERCLHARDADEVWRRESSWTVKDVCQMIRYSFWHNLQQTCMIRMHLCRFFSFLSCFSVLCFAFASSKRWRLHASLDSRQN